VALLLGAPLADARGDQEGRDCEQEQAKKERSSCPSDVFLWG
jgi:hypothetical protein